MNPIYYAKIDYVKPKTGYELASVTVYNLKDYDDRFGLAPFKMIQEANANEHFNFYFYEENKDNFINITKEEDEYVTDKKYTLDMAIESYLELTKDYGYHPNNVDRDMLRDYMNKAKVKQKIKS